MWAKYETTVELLEQANHEWLRACGDGSAGAVAARENVEARPRQSGDLPMAIHQCVR